MRYCIAIFFFLYAALCDSQNFVPNASFENYSSCPNNQGQITYATPWFNPDVSNSGTPDYYNQCSSVAGVPNGFSGFQYARTGGALAGIYLYEPAPPIGTCMTDVREYIECELLDSLISGRKYCVEFYINLYNNSKYAVDAVGAYFSQNAVLTNDYFVLPYQPQVSNPIGNFLSDTSGWMLISGDFVAQGGEKFITIGNFKNDSATNVDTLMSSGGTCIYYYVDDVSVYECSCDTIPPVAKFNYSADSFTVTFNDLSTASANSWQWNFGDEETDTVQNPIHTYAGAGTYTVTLITCNGFCCDTFSVQVSVTGVGIIESSDKNTTGHIYPNPNNGTMQVDRLLNAEQKGEIIIYDYLGKIVFSHTLMYENTSLRLEESLAGGVYYCQLLINSELISSEKIVVIK